MLKNTTPLQEKEKKNPTAGYNSANSRFRQLGVPQTGLSVSDGQSPGQCV